MGVRYDLAMSLRPFSGLLARIIAIPFSVALVVLLLSDRAPGLTQAGLRRGVSVGQLVEGRTGVDVVDRSDLPLSWEQFGHIGLWALAALLAYTALAGSTLSGRVSALRVASGVFALSASFELGQVLFTSTRQLEWADLAANGFGVATGVLVAVGAERFWGRAGHTGGVADTP